MNKKILALCTILCLLLIGCGPSNQPAEENTSMFVVVENNFTWRVMYNKYTKVMYTVSSGMDNAGTVTLLVNSDGTPMLWEEDFFDGRKNK